MKENNEVELSIKVKNDEEVCVSMHGTKPELLAALACIIRDLVEKAGISKSMIKEVVEMGLSGEFETEESKDKEEIDSINKILKGVEEKALEEKALEDIFTEIFRNHK